MSTHTLERPQVSELLFSGTGTRAFAKVEFPNRYRAQVEFDRTVGSYTVETRNEFDFPLRIARNLTMYDVARELERIAADPSADD